MNSEQAIRIQRSVETLLLLGADAEPLYFRARVHRSHAIVSNTDAARPVFHTAAGDAVNIARRLEENAKPGQIVVNAPVVQPVVQTLGHGILARLAGSINIKGLFGLFKVVALLV